LARLAPHNLHLTPRRKSWPTKFGCILGRNLARIQPRGIEQQPTLPTLWPARRLALGPEAALLSLSLALSRFSPKISHFMTLILAFLTSASCCVISSHRQTRPNHGPLVFSISLNIIAALLHSVFMNVSADLRGNRLRHFFGLNTDDFAFSLNNNPDCLFHFIPLCFPRSRCASDGLNIPIYSAWSIDTHQQNREFSEIFLAGRSAFRSVDFGERRYGLPEHHPVPPRFYGLDSPLLAELRYPLFGEAENFRRLGCRD